MLRGDLEGEDLERYVEERVVTTTFEKMLNLARSNSIFPLTFVALLMVAFVYVWRKGALNWR